MVEPVALGHKAKNALIETGERLIAGAAHVAGFDTLGVRLEFWTPGEARVVFDADERHANPMGTLHGAFISGLADTALGMCHISTLEQGETFTTLDLQVRFLRPVWKGRLTCTARMVHRGKTIASVAAEVRDDRDRLVATATSTSMTLRGAPAKGR